MTVASQTSRVSYSGDGSTTAFAVPFYFLAAGDLKVYKGGALQTLTTNYTVSGAGNEAGGTVTFVSAPTSSQSVVILRDTALTQGVDYAPNDPFPAASHEQALDRLTMISQRLNDKLGQALLIPDDEQLTGTVPARATRAGKYLTFDATGNPSVSSTDVQSLVTSAQTSAAAAATSATNAATSATLSADSASSAAAVASTINFSLASFNSSLAATIPTFHLFSGNGTTTTFTLSVNPVNKDAIDVYISGVYQQKSRYSLSGSSVTFSTAPPTGSSNIEIKCAPLVAFQTTTDVDYGQIV